MHDEFDRIMAFFSLSPEEKEERLHEIFEDTVDYFDRFKHIMLNGTPEEKEEAVKKMGMIKSKIEAETKAISEKTGLSEEELQKQAMKKENFSDSQWDTITDAKKKIGKGLEELTSNDEGNKLGESSAPRKRKARKPKKWIQS